MDYSAHTFQPNPGYITCKLNKDVIDFLWARIDK